MSAFEPTITVSSLEEDGVLLLPFLHNEHSALLPPGRAAELDRIYPYTVAIKNRSTKTIIAYTVLWNCTGMDGRTGAQSRSTYNFSDPSERSKVLPGGSQLVGISSGIAGAVSWNGYFDHLLETYSRQKIVAIVLDAVLFSDGSTAGDNNSHWIEKWQAWLDAEKTVFTEFTSASPDAASDAMKAIFDSAIEVYRRRLGSGDETTDPGALGVAADRSSNYVDSLALAKGYFAGSIIREAREKGADSVRANLLKCLKTTQYVSVRKKEKK